MNVWSLNYCLCGMKMSRATSAPAGSGPGADWPKVLRKEHPVIRSFPCVMRHLRLMLPWLF